MKQTAIKRLNILLVFSIALISLPSCNKDLHSSRDIEKNAEIIYNTGIKDYTDVFNKALGRSDHIIIRPGSYNLRTSIYLHSNVILEGKGKVILIKDTIYSHVFINKSAWKDYTETGDSSITIKNITINANNKGTQLGAVHPTANGILSFKFLNNLVLEDVKIVNGDPILFGIHLQSVRNAKVKNYLYDGNKDGFHINGGCENIIIDGFDISSFDDAFGIMTDDYPRVQHNAQDIKNIFIKNGISRKRTPQSGFFVRFMTGSWKRWKPGNKYKIGHTVNYKSHQYKKVNDGESISLICPSHLKGDSLYSDGIVWRYIGEGTNNTSNIYNIHISNVSLEDDRKIVRTINKDSYDYGEYPGTENTSKVDSIFIDEYPFYAFRGKIGFFEAAHEGDQALISSIFILIGCAVLLVVISIKYYRNRKRILSNTELNNIVFNKR